MQRRKENVVNSLIMSVLNIIHCVMVSTLGFFLSPHSRLCALTLNAATEKKLLNVKFLRWAINEKIKVAIYPRLC